MPIIAPRGRTSPSLGPPAGGRSAHETRASPRPEGEPGGSGRYSEAASRDPSALASRPPSAPPPSAAASATTEASDTWPTPHVTGSLNGVPGLLTTRQVPPARQVAVSLPQPSPQIRAHGVGGDGHTSPDELQRSPSRGNAVGHDDDAGLAPGSEDAHAPRRHAPRHPMTQRSRFMSRNLAHPRTAEGRALDPRQNGCGARSRGSARRVRCLNLPRPARGLPSRRGPRRPRRRRRTRRCPPRPRPRRRPPAW